MYNNPLHKSFSKRSNKQALKSCKKLTVFEFYKVMVYCLQRQMVMFMKKLKFADLPPTFRAWRHQNKHLMVLLICRKCPDVLYKIFLKNSCGNSHWNISCYAVQENSGHLLVDIVRTPGIQWVGRGQAPRTWDGLVWCSSSSRSPAILPAVLIQRLQPFSHPAVVGDLFPHKVLKQTSWKNNSKDALHFI